MGDRDNRLVQIVSRCEQQFTQLCRELKQREATALKSIEAQEEKDALRQAVKQAKVCIGNHLESCLQEINLGMVFTLNPQLSDYFSEPQLKLLNRSNTNAESGDSINTPVNCAVESQQTHPCPVSSRHAGTTPPQEHPSQYNSCPTTSVLPPPPGFEHVDVSVSRTRHADVPSYASASRAQPVSSPTEGLRFQSPSPSYQQIPATTSAVVQQQPCQEYVPTKQSYCKSALPNPFDVANAKVKPPKPKSARPLKPTVSSGFRRSPASHTEGQPCAQQPMPSTVARVTEGMADVSVNQWPPSVSPHHISPEPHLFHAASHQNNAPRAADECHQQLPAEDTCRVGLLDTGQKHDNLHQYSQQRPACRLNNELDPFAPMTETRMANRKLHDHFHNDRKYDALPCETLSVCIGRFATTRDHGLQKCSLANLIKGVERECDDELEKRCRPEMTREALQALIDESDGECSICFKEFDADRSFTFSYDKLFQTPCNHLFHLACLYRWDTQQSRNVNKTCPNCRALLPHVPNPNTTAKRIQ